MQCSGERHGLINLKEQAASAPSAPAAQWASIHCLQRGFQVIAMHQCKSINCNKCIAVAEECR